MLHNFFAAPDFLALLRFWDRVRAPSGVAVWDGDFAIVPAELLPNLIVAAWSPVPVYRYVGRECADRFGADPTGLPNGTFTGTVILFVTTEQLIEMLFIKERGEDPSDLIIDMIERFYLQHE